MIACVGETLEAARVGRHRARAARSRSRRSRSRPARTSGSCSPTSRSGRSAPAGPRRPSRPQEAHAFIKGLLDVPGALRRLGQARERRGAARASRTSTARSSAAPRSTSTRSPRFAGPRRTARSARHPRRLGLRAARARATPSSSPTRRSSTGSGREYPHTTLAASGEAVGLPPGQMGNSEVGHLTIGSGRVLFQDLHARQPRDRDGSLFENRRSSAPSSARAARGGDVHLLGLVSHGGVHSHIDHLRALLELAQRAGHGGAHVDPRVHRRPRRLADAAAVTTSPSCPPTGSRRSSAATTRWTATSAGSARERALAAIARGEGVTRLTAVDGRAARATTRGVTDEFIEPVVLDGRPRLAPATTRRSSSTSAPTAARQLTERLLERGIDLTTMTRYRDDFDVPVAFARAGRSPRRSPRCSRAHGVRQLHVAETEKYAHVTYFFNGGGEEEWAGETRILVPSPARRAELRPQAGDVGRARSTAASSRRSATATRSRSSTSRTRTWSATPASIPAVVAGGRDGRRLPRPGRRGGRTPRGGVCLVTADHGNAEQMLEPDGVSPHTAHTTNPVPLVLTEPKRTL